MGVSIVQDNKIYLSAADISKFYNIPLRTIYQRIGAGHYRKNDNGEVCVEDVENCLINPIKRGRRFKDEKNKN